MTYLIAGIQQIGIGVANVYEARDWYRDNLGYGIVIFDEAAEANLMLPYTDNKPQKRHAVLAYNLQSGGGFEIWQYTSRTPVPPKFEIKLGDLGIFGVKIKTTDIKNAYAEFKKKNINIVSELQKTPEGHLHFYFKDPYDNLFEMEENKGLLLNQSKVTSGSSGVILGVADIDRSMQFYKNILGYDTVVYDEEGVFSDLVTLAGGEDKYRRVLLKRSKKRTGAFSPLFGDSTVELIQVIGRQVRKIYENRLWGDLGYIHLCFDIVGMSALKSKCESAGHPFTVDSANSFDMGEAAGHFTYIEDPDGTLIEFVETHKLTIVKKLNWYLDLEKRGQEKSLPKWFFRILALVMKI